MRESHSSSVWIGASDRLTTAPHPMQVIHTRSSVHPAVQFTASLVLQIEGVEGSEEGVGAGHLRSCGRAQRHRLDTVTPAPWCGRSGDRGGSGHGRMSPDPGGDLCVLKLLLAGIGNRPPELHKGHINIDPASVYTAAAIDADIGALSCATLAFAAVEDDAHVTPVPKLSAQLFISVQPGTGDDEDEHVSTSGLAPSAHLWW